ncbi:MAG: hypothetical protein JW774_03405 [Candidatus Aureabacteria bacterium]|nr:hypothetical protein [Candidatus Auribacterota bacterium]
MNTRRKRLYCYGIFVLFMFLGAATRIYGAWDNRYTVHSDAGIVGLMAKHISEAKDFPVFFYGQAYMGSLEAYVTAGVFLLFGISGFTLCLGTAVCGFFMLPLLYLWAKDAAGKTAALAATAYCLVGPAHFFVFSFNPRGGYMLTLCFSVTILFLTCRYLFSEIQQNKVTAFKYAILGCVAGLAWWTNQLITSTLLTSAILFLAVLNRRLFCLRILVPVFSGFIAGSLPFWLWNYQNDWGTFAFLKSFGRTEFLKGLELFYVERIPSLLDLTWGSSLMRWMLLVLYVAVLVVFTRQMFKWIKTGCSRKWLNGAAIILFVLVSSLVFCRSHFALFRTPKYLLTLAPAFAILVGIFISEIVKKRKGILAAFMLMLPFLYHQVDCFIRYGKADPAEKSQQQEAVELDRFFYANRIPGAYDLYGKHSLNFLLKEKYCFSDIRGDRYAPYNRFNEIQDSVSVLNDNAGISQLTLYAKGKSACHNLGGVWLKSVYHDFKPPAEGLHEIPVREIRSITDSGGEAVTSVLTDCNVDTFWEVSGNRENEWIEIEFEYPVPASALRLLCPLEKVPQYWELMGKNSDGEWIVLMKESIIYYYFWNGPRPYWKGRHFRFECRWDPQTVSALRLIRTKTPRNMPWQIRELQVFSPSNETVLSEKDALPELLQILSRNKIKHLYCDRWVANAVYRETKGNILTPLDEEIFDRVIPFLSSDIRFSPDTGVLLRKEETDFCRQYFKAAGFSMRETSIGPWILFDFSPGSWKMEFEKNQNLYWAGYRFLLKENPEEADRKVRRAQSMLKKGLIHEAAEVLQMALKHSALYQPALILLKETFISEKSFKEAEKIQSILNSMVPQFKYPLLFQDGIIFLGLTMDKMTAAPGEDVIVNYFWHVPVDVVPSEYTMFIHFKHGNDSIVQDDHTVLEKIPADHVRIQPVRKTFMEKRRITFPMNSPSGDYRLQLGLFVNKTGRRQEVRGTVPVNNERVATLPLVFKVNERKQH